MTDGAERFVGLVGGQRHTANYFVSTRNSHGAHNGRVISSDLAGALRDAGLHWAPAAGDRFAIPDRGLDAETFVLSDMTIQVYELPQGAVIGFNGTTEWALDDIERDEAIWLPREDQLRDLLGDWFRRLERAGDVWTVVVDGQPDTVASSAEEAYGRAVLRTLKPDRPGSAS